ncbi:hypothetical protein HO173_001320 [Letharia columbiana]|uniref:Major facilitator superfamily (MFS) profile domain-containing protein n=1 Tax=Letharia columbiana TaxID=112416 RepID=A0A8H6G4Y3_9LECA|nr:uncharacterized protein HO173_001320 [Letharia columbiana]KAF6240648.1 hypothetical protein HO173_001320 [Letharia columbiana]
MAEPIGPEVYLAIATSMQNAVDNHRDKKRAEQNNKLAIISADSSKASLTLPADESLSCSGLKVGNDGYVQWAMDSPAHPRNWSRDRKAYDLGLILFLEFSMSAVSAGGTPASFYGSGVLGHGREVGLVGFTTMYLLGQALGALLLSPYADKFGRRTLYIASAFLYSVFCLPVAATSNVAGVFVGRFVTGVISAIPAITTRRSIEDLFGTEGRMWAFFSWALATNLGLVLGPIYTSYVAVSLNWRWPFYLATIIVVVTGMLMYFIRESHTSRLLERKVAAIQSHRADLILRTAPVTPQPSIFQPVIFFFTKPIIFLSSVANAFSTALLYLFAIAFPLIYAHYAWSRQKTTLIFLFIALGLFFSTLTRFHDRHASRQHRLTQRRLAPEKGLLGLAIGAPVLAVALWWFAWTIPGVHVKVVAWPASAISLILLGYGVNEHSTVLPRYILESHTKSENDAASAFAALLAARALLGAVFPLFTQHMFDTLGANPAASILAAIATASCLLPVVLAMFGAKLRGSGTSGGTDDDDDDRDSRREVRVEKVVKSRKTVRWGDEAGSGIDDDDDDGSEAKSEDSTEGGSTGSSEMARTETGGGGDGADISEMSRAVTETKVARRDLANPDVSEVETKNEDKDEDGVSQISRVETRKSGSEIESGGSESARVARVDTKGSSAGGGADGEKKKKKKKEKRRRKERTRVDGGDDGAAGFLGMDLERLAVFPYF